MKYSMVAINGKEPVPGEIYVRRVLISFTGKNQVSIRNIPGYTYTGTRIIEKDDYFKDLTRANQYDFRDDNYVLTRTDYAHNRFLEAEKRQYHYYDFETLDPYYNQMRPIEFEAESDAEAIKKFNERKELR